MDHQETDHDKEVRRGDFAKREGEVILREHEYDGIQEYDQKLPNWWLFTLYAAILFFILAWFVYYQTGLVRTDQQAVTADMALIQNQKKNLLAKTLETLDDATLVNEWASDAAIVAKAAGYAA